MPPKKAAAKNAASITKAKASTTTSTRPTRVSKVNTAAESAVAAAPEIKKTKTVPAKKTAPKKAPITKSTGTKRKAPVEVSEEEEAPKAKKSKAETASTIKPVSKKPTSKKPAVAKKAPATQKPAEPEKAPLSKTVAPPKKAAVPKATPIKKALPRINSRPTQKLDIYVFGEGTAGELGLGGVKYDGNKKPIDVARPRINHRLSARDVGVVQIAVGGMHCAALTHDNKILTWGVNDTGALGRRTGAAKTVEITPKEASVDSDSDSEDEDDEYLNPTESEPREVNPKYFPEGTQFAQLAASDSATFAITTDGSVYGWGTFRGNDGDLGFRPKKMHSALEDEEYEGESEEARKERLTKETFQRSPMLIPELKKIVAISCGTNHILALDHKGKVFTWGAGEQNQLARRVVARTAEGALIPREFGLQRKKITKIGAGDYHSFAVDKDDKVYAWGLNTFSQTGIPTSESNDDTILVPTLVKNLNGYKLKELDGGAHHTIACTETGQVLIWGRIDNKQGGMDVSKFSGNDVFIDDEGRRRYLNKPVVLPNMNGETVSAYPDGCLVVTKEGLAYSWGFSGNYQTGLGTTVDVVEATHIDNTAVRGKKLVYCGAGGQFGVLGGVHEDVEMGEA